MIEWPKATEKWRVQEGNVLLPQGAVEPKFHHFLIKTLTLKTMIVLLSVMCMK